MFVGTKTTCTSNNDEFVYIPFFDDVKAAAGTGCLVDNENITGTLSFRKDWMHINGISVKSLSALHVSGDSMAPTLINGDILLVDHSQTIPAADRIFVVRCEDGVVIKRSGGIKDNELLLLSDNASIKPRIVDLTDKSVAVIGRVVWYGRTI